MNIPPIIKGLLLINIAAYIIDELFGNQLSLIFGLYYFAHPNFGIWQLFTYMFMHGGFMHLFFNMFALWMFGRIMEQTWGPKKMIIYYLICGLGAGLTQELGQSIGLIEPYARTIGASGAVYGILLAFGMTYPNERLFVIPIPFPIKAKYFVGFYAALELMECLTMKDGVAHAAHLGGMLFGALLIILWKRKASRNSYYQGQSFWSQTTTYDSYDKGEDSFFDKLTGMFKNKKPKGPKMTVSYGNRQADYKYNEEKKKNDEEIDRILDKVRRGGYSCLTEDEKKTLFDASKR
jgi:membrane associated rhomboid family serine protease